VDRIITSFTTPLEIQLALGLALLIGLAIGWVARGWGERYEIEKAGVWRCEDRGYYLCLVKEGGSARSPGLPDQVAVEKSRSAT
jgi:hypothetical protein